MLNCHPPYPEGKEGHQGRNVRVEEIGKRLDDWGDHTRGAIVFGFGFWWGNWFTAFCLGGVEFLRSCVSYEEGRGERGGLYGNLGSDNFGAPLS